VLDQPEDAVDKAKSQYKDVIVGGDIWMVLEEIMTYMRNPLKYHNQRVKLPRVSLLGGAYFSNLFVLCHEPFVV
jgi:cell division protease FtsH